MKKRVLACLVMLCLLVAMLPSVASAADSGTQYVAFSTAKGAYTAGTWQFNTYYNEYYNYTSNVMKLYVMEQSEFAKYSSEADAVAHGQVAYCFNASYAWPTQWNGNAIYTKLSNVNHDQFTQVATDARDAANLDKWIISICLNGYPYDYSGFNKNADGTNIISDDAFRVLTQKAIWYYSDSDTWADPNVNGELDDRTTEAEREVLAKLVSTRLSDSVIEQARAALDLYLWDTTTTAPNDGTHSSFQNLLSVSQAKVHSLTLTKHATDGSANDEFTFKVTVTPSSGNSSDFWVSDANQSKFSKNNDGSLNVTLKEDQSVTIDILSDSYTYSIEEIPADTYASGNTYTSEPTITVTGTGTVDENNKLKVSGTDVTGDESVVYTNINSKYPTVDEGSNVGWVFVNKKVAFADDDTHHLDKIPFDETFTFEMVLKNADGTPYTGVNGYVEYDVVENGDDNDEALLVSADGKIKFSITNHETAEIELPDGVSYTLTEVAKDGATVNYGDGNNGKITGTMTTGAVNQYEITNQYADETSNTLVIKKELDGEALAGNTAPFTFDVSLSDTSFNGNIYYKDTDEVIGTFENGSGTFQIDAGEYATIKGLHAGTSASVKEEEMPYGYEIKTLTVTRTDSTGKETEINQLQKNVNFGLAEVGTIGLGANTYTVTFVNTKSETEKPNTVVIKKVLDNATSSSSNTKFTFTANIEGFTGDAYIDGTKTVAGTFDENGDGTITLAAGQSVTFTGLEPLARFGVMESEIPSNYSFVSVAATIQHGDEAAEELKSLDGDEDAAQKMMVGQFASDTDNTVTITFTNHADKTTTETPTTPTPTTTETPDKPDETEETGEPTPLSTETTETDESSMDNADDQEDKSTMSNQNSVPADTDATETLPQTGMNWFPIVILLAAGLALILAGAAAHNRRKSGT